MNKGLVESSDTEIYLGGWRSVFQKRSVFSFEVKDDTIKKRKIGVLCTLRVVELFLKCLDRKGSHVCAETFVINDGIPVLCG